MKWKQVDVPSRQHTGDNMWNRTVPPELVREMRSNPGVTYLLHDDNMKPLEWTQADVAALTRSNRQPFRVQSRRVRKDGQGKDPRFVVYVSMDPAHWERVAQRRSEKERDGE